MVQDEETFDEVSQDVLNQLEIAEELKAKGSYVTFVDWCRANGMIFDEGKESK